MKKFQLTLAAITLMAFIGCDKKTESTTGGNSANTTKVSALDADVCGKCGCCAGCDECCNAEVEKCSCGFNKGSLLCCVARVEPGDAVYCKKCGHEKGTKDCCAAANTTCSKCGLAKGAPLCCKLNDKSADAVSHDPDEKGEHSDEGGSGSEKPKEQG